LVKNRTFQAAGSALVWKGVQLVVIKGIFMMRLLILARLLSPEDFGLLAIATTVIGFLLNVTDLGMNQALVQRARVDEQEYNVAWTVGLARALFITAGVALMAPTIARVFAEPQAMPIIRVLALRPTVDALASIKVAELIRNLCFRELTIVRLAQAVANTAISIALARTLGAWALVAGALSGAAAFVVMSYFLAPHRPRFSLDRLAARPLVRFGRWVFLTGLVVMAGSYVLRVVISRQLGATELGLYFLGAQLGFLPAEMAYEVVGSVAFPLFARFQSDVLRATEGFRTMFTGMCAALYPVCALLIALAPRLVQDVLDDRWTGTMPVIQILALVSLIGILGEACAPVLKGLGQPYKVTVLEAMQSLVLVGLAWQLASRHGLVGAALAWLPAVITSQILCAIFVRQALDRPFAGLGAPMLTVTFTTGVGAVVAVVIGRIVPGLVGLLASGILAVAVIGALLWGLDRRFALGLAEDLGRTFPQMARLVGHTAKKARPNQAGTES
jgi:O-antigen/teichoic acid export membrane protein